MRERLAFVDDPRRLASLGPADRLVALSPLVELAAELEGIVFVRPEDYVDPIRVEEEGDANFDRVERLCDELDALDVTGTPGVRLARCLYFPLKVLYDGLFVRADALRRLVEAEGAADARLLVGPDVLWGSVLQHAFPHCPLEPQPALDVAPGFRRAPGTPARALARRLVDGLGTLRRHRGGRPWILCLDRMYSIRPIAAELRRLGCDVSFLRSAPIALVPVQWACIEASPAVRALFVWDGADYWPAAAPRLRRLIEQELPLALAGYRAAERLFARRRPAAVLTSQAVFPHERGVCEAARGAGVISVVARHGELGMRNVRMVAYQDVDVVDWALCWGAWEAAWLERHAHRPVGAKVVGAPMIEEAVRGVPKREQARAALGIRPGERVVLYAPTNLSGEDWYASRRTPSDSDYFRHQTAVIRSLVTAGSSRVIVKEHPSAAVSPLEEWCRSFAPEVRVIREPAFAELIDMPDAVVIDAPSTTLVRALFGSARIHVVDQPVFAWEPGVVEHLARHGVIFSGAEEVGACVRSSLASRLPEYSAEAREPLVASGPGTAAQRAAHALLEIVSSP